MKRNYALPVFAGTSIFNNTEREHSYFLEAPLDILWEDRVKIKLSKCFYGFQRAEERGHVADKEGLKPSEHPASDDDLMSFLGQSENYHRCHGPFKE